LVHSLVGAPPSKPPVAVGVDPNKGAFVCDAPNDNPVPVVDDPNGLAAGVPKLNVGVVVVGFAVDAKKFVVVPNI
jgi:hypothetical protein